MAGENGTRLVCDSKETQASILLIVENYHLNLDFDEFEDEYPEINNQRFYGFKQLNLKNNFNDKSQMHEIVANELFRDFGLVVSHASFYALYINVDGSNDPCE